MKSLLELGIRVHHRNGTQRTTCPKCSPTRKHKSDKCLSVTITGTEVKFYCHHCGHSGGIDADQPKDKRNPISKEARRHNDRRAWLAQFR